jgi:pyridoxamine 5'-phosphate oxidase
MTESSMDHLDGVLDHIIGTWAGAVRNRHSPLHTPTVCSVAGDAPAPRIMVLRAVEGPCATFRFHTDVRSSKALQIDAAEPVAILGYDPEARVQLIVRGVGRIERSGETVNRAWETSALSSRRCYLAAHPPGTQTPEATSGLPEALLNRSPTAPESEAGRENFCVLLVDAVELEWLKLTSCGNQRALFQQSGNGWTGNWITP